MAAGMSFNLGEGSVVTDDMLQWRTAVKGHPGVPLWFLIGSAYLHPLAGLAHRLDPGGGPTKAGGSRSRVRDPRRTPAQQCRCGCSRGPAAVGSAGVALPLSSTAQVHVQNRGAETIDLGGKGSAAGSVLE